MVRTSDSMLIMVLYVDDLLIIGSSAVVITTIKSSMHERFSMIDMGILNFFIGLEIN